MLAQWPNFWNMQAGNSMLELAAFAKGRGIIFKVLRLEVSI
jgi:hypothetical protein